MDLGTTILSEISHTEKDTYHKISLIEGMGIMNKIPLLIVKDSEITEGVFDECLSESFVFRIDANSDIRKLSSSTAFHDWLEQIN